MTDIMVFHHNEELHTSEQSDLVVPLIYKLFKPKSVLDVGCGLGNWLYSFKKVGVEEVFGIDGGYVDREKQTKYLENSEFLPLDLSLEFDLKRKFDLVISLEVAEHLPSRVADNFVKNLTRHSDLIVFSAAIPNQGGQGHLNEQYLDYWEKKFEIYGFKLFDIIRGEIWELENLNFWYKQNIVVFSKSHLELKQKDIINIVHPQQLEKKQMDFELIHKKYRDIVTGKSGFRNSLKILLKSIIDKVKIRNN